MNWYMIWIDKESEKCRGKLFHSNNNNRNKDNYPTFIEKLPSLFSFPQISFRLFPLSRCPFLLLRRTEALETKNFDRDLPYLDPSENQAGIFTVPIVLNRVADKLKVGEEERWPRNATYPLIPRSVSSKAPLSLLHPSLLSPRNRNLAFSLLASLPAGKQSEYSLLARASEEQISSTLDGSRRLTCLETSSVCHRTLRREINQSVEICLEESRLAFDYARTFGIAWRVEQWETNGNASFHVLRKSGGFTRFEKTDPLENRDWW